jgi:hypothetical protein
VAEPVAATTVTPFYRLQTATDVVIMVLTLFCHGYRCRLS